jgi:hypothetical protein
MALKVSSVQRITNNFNKFEVQGTITATGNVPASAATSDALDLTGLVASNSLPDNVWIFEKPLSGTSGYGGSYLYAPSTTQANGTVQVFSSGGALYTAAGSYASLGLTTLYFLAQFPKFG